MRSQELGLQDRVELRQMGAKAALEILDARLDVGAVTRHDPADARRRHAVFQQPQDSVHAGLAHCMIIDVAEVWLGVCRHQIDIEAHEAVADVHEWRDGPLDGKKLALQVVDAARCLMD